MTIKERLLKNSGSTLNESVEDKIKEVEIKERATRIITSFQREILSLVQFINNGGITNYCGSVYSKENSKENSLKDEDISKLKKNCFMYLMSKASSLKEDIVEAFELSEEQEEKEVEVTVVAPQPEMKMALPSLFGY